MSQFAFQIVDALQSDFIDILSGAWWYSLTDRNDPSSFIDRLFAIYLEADALTFAVLFLLFFIAVSLIIGWSTRDYSTVDRLWSIIPAWYAIHFYWHARFVREYSGVIDWAIEVRSFGISVVIAIWSVRLTYNFWRKGGYSSGGEDYRWIALRTRYITQPLVWELYHIVFIVIYQQFLLFLLALPVYVASLIAEQPINGVDVAALISGLFAVFIETIADEQQWNFQQAKLKYKNNIAELETISASLAEDVKNGFLTRGLFRYSRHPNFFGELFLWWSVYGIAHGAVYGDNWISPPHISVLGATLLTLLFEGSTFFTEHLSKQKYGEAYEAYRSRTSPILPLWSSNVPTIKNEEQPASPSSKIPVRRQRAASIAKSEEEVAVKKRAPTRTKKSSVSDTESSLPAPKATRTKKSVSSTKKEKTEEESDSEAKPKAVKSTNKTTKREAPKSPISKKTTKRASIPVIEVPTTRRRRTVTQV